MQIDAPPKPEKTYVTVLASIDQTGLMEPREIIWPDGRKFPIDRVECWRKALDHGPETTYYVIEIGGRKRILYFTQSPICKDKGTVLLSSRAQSGFAAPGERAGGSFSVKNGRQPGANPLSRS